MPLEFLRPSLVGIIDIPHGHGLHPLAVVGVLLEAGVGMVQLRAKHSSAAERRTWAESIGAACRGRAPLIINDDIELVEGGAPGISGVHLGQSDLARLGRSGERRIRELRGSGLVVGLSTHTLQEVECTLALEPDYIGFGPVFPTRSKADCDPVVGVGLLREACERAGLPVVAIGGINSGNVGVVLAAGAAAVAVIGALSAPTLAKTRECCLALSMRLGATSMS